MTLLPGWEKYIELPIDHTKIDADMLNYPLAILLSAAAGIGNRDMSFIFAELGSNWAKLAVAIDDGTECYVEKVEWAEGTPFAELWSGIVAVSSAADTMVRLFYSASHADNSTYVGVTGSVPGIAVWTADGNYKAVYHMNDNPDTSHIADSTGNYNGTKKGAGEPAVGDYTPGKGQDFDGTNDSVNFTANYIPAANFTWETLLNQDIVQTRYLWAQDGNNPYPDRTYIRIITNKLTFSIAANVNTANSILVAVDNNYLAITRVTNAIAFYLNGATDGGGTETRSPAQVSTTSLGSYYNSGSVDGKISETRISDIARPDAHIKANQSNWTDDLVTFGEETLSVILLSASDGIKLSESQNILWNISAIDGLKFSEIQSLLWELSASDAVKLSELQSILWPLSVSESLKLSDTNQIIAALMASEGLSLSDFDILRKYGYGNTIKTPDRTITVKTPDRTITIPTHSQTE